MDTQQKDKLARYLKNATKFFWGLGGGKKDENYKWIRGHGFEFKDRSYNDVTNQLLANYGIERIIEGIVIPRVKELYGNDLLEVLHQCWKVGLRPNISSLVPNKYGYSSPLLVVNIQNGYVEGWSEFAGVWFEEIEPIFCQGRGNSI